MTNLKALYERRKVFIDYKTPIPEELKKEISDAENEIFGTIKETLLGYLPEEIEMPADASIIFGLEYRDGKLVKTAMAINQGLEDKFDTVSNYSDEESEDNNEEFNDSLINPTNKRKGFTVKFSDGKIIKYPTAQRTMIEALRYMGLERASHFRDELFKGFPLIGKEKRTTDGRFWQRMVDGWWIYINLGNDRKIACLKGIAKMLNIPIEIIQDEEVVAEPENRMRGRRALYSLNGGQPMQKNRSVQAAVRLFLKEVPIATFEEIQYQFPSRLQGSYGVVRTLTDIKNRCEYNSTESRRWFLDPSDILTDANGIKFTVSTEWGDNFVNFQQHLKSDLGWTIEAVCDNQ